MRCPTHGRSCCAAARTGAWSATPGARRTTTRSTPTFAGARPARARSTRPTAPRRIAPTRRRTAAAGTRHPLTCHQHARGCRAPAATTRHPPVVPPNFRLRTLDPHLAHDGLPAAVLRGSLGAGAAPLVAALGEHELARADPARPRAGERLGALLAAAEV